MDSSSQTENGKRIAICSFKNRVSPRFDLTHEILIFDLDNSGNPVEVIHTSFISPEERFIILAKRGIHTLIVGGMQPRFQEMFLNDQIEVIWGVIGEVKDVLQAYSKGTLYAGMGSIRDSRKGRERGHGSRR